MQPFVFRRRAAAQPPGRDASRRPVAVGVTALVAMPRWSFHRDDFAHAARPLDHDSQSKVELLPVIVADGHKLVHDPDTDRYERCRLDDDPGELRDLLYLQ